MPKRHQIAALPVRRGAADSIEVMLITSRETGRWVIPKGWPWPNVSEHEAAAGEAWEEAGVRGHVGAQKLGSFTYEKRRDSKSRRVEVSVFELEVSEEANEWPENGQRRREWFTPRTAAELVLEPELKELILAYEIESHLGHFR
jgi:8-oxo-dGTP pyrophosphatase MutT (NUDIX family)